MGVKTYDPSQVALIFGGFEIEGYADDTFVVVDYDEDAFTHQKGSSGEGVRSKSNNDAATITITLLQSSASNDLLSAIALADKVANAGVHPVLVKDNSGSSLHTGESAWIQKVPAAAYAKTAGNREWVLKVDSLISHVGSN